MKKNLVKIHDYFDLNKIADSGQIFRIKRFDNDTFRFIFKENILYIKKIDKENFEISCSLDQWNKIWFHYFDLETNYKNVCTSHLNKHPTINKAITFSKGIRILKQDPWEMLISFIISQNKNIPAIKHSIEDLCALYGTQITTEMETLFLFPTIQQLNQATEQELLNCRIGYRVPYIKDAINRIKTGDINLNNLNILADSDLIQELMRIKGVGSKVANCIALYGFHRTNIAPIDVWIQKVINEDFNGVSPFGKINQHAGIIQQFLFYTKRNN